jgi:hypothetical protein
MPNGDYAARVRKAADWLIAHSQADRDGLIHSGHPSETTRYMEGHGLATLFLAAVHEDEFEQPRRKKLYEVLTRAVKYLVKAQSSQGGWYHTSKAEGHDLADPLVTAIQIQALQAARNIGALPVETIHDAQAYLKTALAKQGKEQAGLNRATEIAAAFAACYAFQINIAKDDVSKRWLERCRSEIPLGKSMPFDRAELAHYYYAQALVSHRWDDWSNYRTVLFDHLQSTQHKDGSWPAANGLGVGPVYATALWCTLMQLDRWSHPLKRLDRITVTVTSLRLEPRPAFARALPPVSRAGA